MKICPKCGAEADGVFCIHCGAAVNGADSAPAAEAPAVEKPMGDAPQQPVYTPPVQPTYTAPQQPYGGYQPPYYSPQQPAEEPISVGGWIGRSLIPCIPFVGSIIYLIMLFVWMGDKTKEATFRNWAKAQLIVTGIAVGLCVLFFIMLLGLGWTMADVIGEAVYY